MAKKTATTMSTLTPLLSKGKAVDWWFIFKFNAGSFPGCGGTSKRKGIFGGKVHDYHGWYSQQYIYASSANPELQKGTGCLGDSLNDPLGATFAQVYFGSSYYVVWNDQFYGDPKIPGCEENCESPWGHSKGMVAWDDNGDGFVMQVSTPSWPASGNQKYPRKTDGNTLGCIKDDDVEVSQHFFALKINKDDLVNILTALKNSSVATDPTNKQIVLNGGPSDVQSLVNSLGQKSKNWKVFETELSSGAKLISKPSKLSVPPWQMVSSVLGGVPLRVASWWDNPEIYSTTSSTKIYCWDDSLGWPGAVKIATTGNWEGTEISLTGGTGRYHNHAKFGVSTWKNKPYSIFGDMNQQGALAPGYAYDGQKCDSSQNGRGGLFYVLNNYDLFESVSKLLSGDTAPVKSVWDQSI